VGWEWAFGWEDHVLFQLGRVTALVGAFFDAGCEGSVEVEEWGPEVDKWYDGVPEWRCRIAKGH